MEVKHESNRENGLVGDIDIADGPAGWLLYKFPNVHKDQRHGTRIGKYGYRTGKCEVRQFI